MSIMDRAKDSDLFFNWAVEQEWDGTLEELAQRFLVEHANELRLTWTPEGLAVDFERRY